MTTLLSFKSFSRCGITAATCLSLSLLAHAVAPNAVDDDLTVPPVNQNQTKVISEATLIANDAGDGKNIEAAGPSSAAGAAVSWSNGASQVTYDPTAVAAFIALDSTSAPVDDTFTYRLGGTDGPDSTGTVTVRVQGVNDAPTISGMPGGTLNTNDNDATNTPFGGVVIGDPDTGEMVTVTVTINAANEGTFTNLNGFTDNTGGNYTYTGTVSNATTRVAGLNFVPTPNRLTPGASDNTVLTVSVSDQTAPAVNASRTVNVTSINDVPIVTPGATRSVNDNATLTVFSGVSFTDPDNAERLDVTVTYNQAKGTFSGSGFTESGSGTNRVLSLTPNQTVANAQSLLRALVFTPTANQVIVGNTENLTFAIEAEDNDNATDAENLTVTVTSINDNPVLNGNGGVTAYTMSSGETRFLYTAATLSDADIEAAGSGEGIGDDFTATIALSGGAPDAGTIISGDFTGGSGTYTFTGKRTEVEQAIQAVSYLAPSANGTFTISLSVVDANLGTSDALVATATVLQPNPGVTGLVSGQQVADNGVIFPFASVVFNSFGSVDRIVEITVDLDAKGNFDILGAFSKSGTAGTAPTGFVYSMTGSAVSATNSIQNLRFVPTPNRISGAFENVTFSIKVKEVSSGAELSSDPLVVKVVPVNNAPTISSDGPEVRIDDDEVATPFATMGLSDPDAGGMQPITVTISLIGEDPVTDLPLAGGGTLAPAPGAPAVAGVTFTPNGTYPDTTYTIVGKPVDVTTFLQALVFTPEANRNAVGERETVRFTVFVDDLNGGTAQNQGTTVIVLSVNGAPQINGVPPLSLQPFAVAASGNAMTIPFAGLSVVDEEDLDFTITLDDATKGTLSVTDFTDAGGGVYTMTGSPTALTTALQALVFTLEPTHVFPPGQQGLTTFTLGAADSTNTTTKVFTIFIRERNVAHIVSSQSDSGPGSLREAIALAGNGDMIVFDFPVDDFPVTLLLQSTLIINKNLSIVGSGVDQLAISGGGSVGLISTINGAELTVEQLTLKDGAASSYGGAIAVDTGAKLEVRHCAFVGNSAGQYGGAIDVYEGELVVEHCLFHQNSVTGSTAKAGGAISIYSTVDSSITNSTFVGNLQESAGGFGGGALFAENGDLAQYFDLWVEHCTFSDNIDAAMSGSAVLAASAGLEVQLRNNIFDGADGPNDVVLDVLGGGRFDSMGGNIASDSTTTTYTQGVAQNVTLLDHLFDQSSTDPLVDALADNEGATWTCALLPGSPALDAAVAVSPVGEALGTDQRGVWRGGSVSDIGAFESAAYKRLNINELMVAAGAGADFIEFYNPRESDDLDMAGLTLWIDGVLVHTFAAQALAPGAGVAWTSTIDLSPEKGEVVVKNADGQKILEVDYVATFSEEGTELVTTGQSINRYPRYEGGFLPHQRVVDNVTGVPSAPGTNLNSPGDDVDGSPLGGGNAPPTAVADVDVNKNPIYAIFANEVLSPNVLLNDIEFDRTDTLKITEVMALVGGDVNSVELLAVDTVGVISLANLPTGLDTTIAPLGAAVTIDGDQLGLSYDPTASPFMIALSEGETVTDIWAYTMRDFDATGTAQDRGPLPVNLLKEAANIVKATTYFTVTVTGVNEAPEPLDDPNVVTAENQAIRLLSDTNLLAPAVFNFGDLDANFQDRNAMGVPVTLKPAPPITALLANDDDVDNDDSGTTLLLVAVHTTAVPGNLLETTSELGARVVLDIRAERMETSIVYDPRSSSILNALSEGEVAIDSFYYSVFDSHGARGVAKVTVTVTGVNDVPIAVDDSGYVANEDASLTILGADLLANDTDPDQNQSGPEDIPTILLPFDMQSALGAGIDFDGTTVTYDPRMIDVYESLARNETILDTLTYRITDMMGGTSQATVTIVVEGRNDAPVAANDLLEILENDTTVVVAANGLLSNDEDVDINGSTPDDDPWVLPQRDFRTPLGAELDINPDGSYRYDANSAAIDSLIENELAVEIFPYTVIDNFRTTASDDVFRVRANRTNVVLPVLLNDAVVGSSATAVAGYAADVADPANLIIESTNHALRDGMMIRIEGYAGLGAYNGVYPVTSIDRDHFSVVVPFVDDPAGTRGTWRPWFTISAISAASQGGVVSSPTGQSLRYTPPGGFYGEETLTYTIEDGAGGQDVAKVTLQVILPPLNGFMSASADRFRIGMGQAAVVVDVLANDHTLPSLGSALTILSPAPVGGATGLLEVVNGGQFLRYTPPAPTFTGEESFTYSVTGGGTATAETTVTFEVVDRTGLLSGSDDDYFVVTGSSANILNVLANDPSLPSFPVSSTLVAIGTTSSGGTATMAGNTISYSPPAAPFLGTDAFTYTSRDASGATTTQNVRVQVVPNTVNFHAKADHYVVVAGSGPVLLPVLLNDGVVANPTATLSVVNLGLDTDSPPDVGRVAIVGGNMVRYTPPAAAETEEFNYEISIGTVARREARITVTVVDSFETVPEPEDDFYRVAKNSGPHTLDVLKNDIPYPAAGWAWTITGKTNGDKGGSIAIAGGGTSLTYTPLVGFFGTETFTYTISDSFGDSATATVSIRVGELITAPDAFAVLEGSVDNPLAVLANDDLLDTFGPDYTISGVDAVSAGLGTLSIVGAGPNNHLLYTPQAGFVGADSFSYTVVDQTGDTRDETAAVLVLPIGSDRAEAELRVEITGVNDLPMLTGTANGGITDKQSINPFASVSITDLDEAGNQSQTVVVSYNSSFGTVVAPGMTMTSGGVWRIVGTPAAVTAALNAFHFTPYENFIDYINPGQANVVFTLSIDDGYIPTPILDATTITVTPINDAPTVFNPIPDQVLHVNAFPRGFHLPLHFADVDDNVSGGQLTWTVTGNTNPALFDSVTINPTSQFLVLDFAADQAGVSDITVRGTDRGLLFVEATFRVTVEGPPVIVLAAGETKPPAAVFVPGSESGFRRDYKQSFRISNEGTLPADAFILHVSDLDQPVEGITVNAATFSTNENGTPTNFADDVTTAAGVSIQRISTYVYAVNYDVPIAPGGSVVVHLTYRVSSVGLVSIRPTIRVELSTTAPRGPAGISQVGMDGDRIVHLTLNVLAGRTYRLEYGTDLLTWTPWTAPIPVSLFDRRIEVIDDGLNTGVPPSLTPRRQYRLVDVSTP